MTRPSCYPKLWQLKLSEAQLQGNFYPRPHPSSPGKAVIYNIESSYFTVIPGRYRRTCERCTKLYDIQPNGFQSRSNEQCVYHPQSIFGRPPRYKCCLRELRAMPCAKAPWHITRDIDPYNLTGFISTRNHSRITTKNVYAFDCEMISTTVGLELASISVVDSNCELVYETMVLPDNPILDYLTEHSGLEERDFIGVTTRLENVHAKLLTLFGDNTILVGHGLYNDMIRLKLFHDNIVDTSVIYPHAKGKGYRYSLKVLKEQFLPPGLTNANIPKAREDAVSAMELALLKCN